ncbi:squalene/phytoene synthase family protein [Streptomyces rishiriensis]|uniref:squalene/phytoene synthase family protein n=1 Tax=Streptomyces rishiriensis TaxID=68264 RepID=UPI00379368F7
MVAHGFRADACADSGPVADRRHRLTEFAEATRAAFAPGGSHAPVLHALVHTYRTFGMPLSLIEDMFTGMRRDVDFRDFATYAELCQWVTQVAGSPAYGVLWTMVGTELTQAQPLMREVAEPTQLADVLCDLSDDLDDGRLYLPLRTSTSSGCTPRTSRPNGGHRPWLTSSRSRPRASRTGSPLWPVTGNSLPRRRVRKARRVRARGRERRSCQAVYRGPPHDGWAGRCTSRAGSRVRGTPQPDFPDGTAGLPQITANRREALRAPRPSGLSY